MFWKLWRDYLFECRDLFVLIINITKTEHLSKEFYKNVSYLRTNFLTSTINLQPTIPTRSKWCTSFQNCSVNKNMKTLYILHIKRKIVNHFRSKFHFYTPENIRKPEVFLRFQGVRRYRLRLKFGSITRQKMKFSIKDFFSKCHQIRRKLRIWSHLLKKSLIENFIFCTVCFRNI